MLIQSCVPTSFEDLDNNSSNEDVHVSVHRSYKLQKISLHKTPNIVVGVVDDNPTYGTQPCKLCNRSESVLNLLLCDRCEEGFHVACCNPNIVLPLDEWFCHSCAKMTTCNSELTMSSRGIGEGMGRCQFEFGPVLSPIEAMMKWPERFVSRVRIGEAYQADVPDWAPLKEVKTGDGNCSHDADYQKAKATSFINWWKSLHKCQLI